MIKEQHKSTNNLLYDIITQSEPNILFNYSILLIIAILLFSNLNLTINFIVAIFVGFIIINYLYTHKTIYDTSILTEKKEKFDMINTTNEILKNHDKFTNVLFYIEDFEYLNISLYDTLK